MFSRVALAVVATALLASSGLAGKKKAKASKRSAVRKAKASKKSCKEAPATEAATAAPVATSSSSSSSTAAAPASTSTTGAPATTSTTTLAHAVESFRSAFQAAKDVVKSLNLAAGADIARAVQTVGNAIDARPGISVEVAADVKTAAVMKMVLQFDGAIGPDAKTLFDEMVVEIKHQLAFSLPEDVFVDSVAKTFGARLDALRVLFAALPENKLVIRAAKAFAGAQSTSGYTGTVAAGLTL